MGKKKLVYSGVKPIGGATLKSRRLARKITSSYHNIRNELAFIAKSKMAGNTAMKEKKAELEEELKRIGGVEKYQQVCMNRPTYGRNQSFISEKFRHQLLVLSISSLPNGSYLCFQNWGLKRKVERKAFLKSVR
jgi:hypothetical protein